jgi:hypothetical protein
MKRTFASLVIVVATVCWSGEPAPSWLLPALLLGCSEVRPC